MSEWIDVDEELPEAETDVLVAGIRFSSWHTATAGLFEGKWLSQETERELKFDVSHWMPLMPMPATPMNNRLEKQ